MSQKIKCPKCNNLIDVDEQIRKEIEKKVRNENKEDEREKLEKLLRNFSSKVKNWMFSCRNCLSKKLIKVVNIGSQPLSGVFYKKKPLI